MMKQLLSATAIALVLLAQGASAQTGDDENAVLARVNGLPVTAADVAFGLETLAPALERVPAQERPAMVLDLMVDMHLLADAAEKAGLASDPVVAQRTEYYRTQTLRDLYMEQLIDDAVTDAAVKARYDEEVAKLEPTREVSASHILVPDEDKARELIAELNAGADFAELAAENSQDPGSAQRGGSLGFFGPGQMVKPFEDAAFSLDKGAITQEPVRSQFGYHIIKLDDDRERSAPPLEDVSDDIRNILVREIFVNEINRLKETANIEMLTGQQ